MTIFYENPKFKQIELTVADLKKIAEETKVAAEKKGGRGSDPDGGVGVVE